MYEDIINELKGAISLIESAMGTAEKLSDELEAADARISNLEDEVEFLKEEIEELQVHG